MIFTLLYNLPKFFELYIKEDLLTKVVNCEEMESEPDLYSKYLKNCTEADSMKNITIPDLGGEKFLTICLIIIGYLLYICIIFFIMYYLIIDDENNTRYSISIAPTKIRSNRLYIRIYILWCNLIIQVTCIYILLNFTFLRRLLHI